MTIKVGEKEYSFDGYAQPLQSIQKLAEECYQQGKADEIEEVILALKNYSGEQRYLISENVWEIIKGLKEQKNE